MFRFITKCAMRVLCWIVYHDWEVIEGWNLLDTRPPMFKCNRCGKEEGL